MSDHAAVKEEHRELLIKVIAAIDCRAYGDARQLLVDFARGERLKGLEALAETYRAKGYRLPSMLSNASEKLKRGEA